MSFTKFASFEVSEVLDVKGAPTKQHTASLDRLSDYHDYRTSDGYMYVRIRAISSRVNKNNDGWPSIELAGSQDVFNKHVAGSGFTLEADSKAKYGYSTFVGKPIFVDHNNSDPKRSRGVIVDAKLHVEDHKTASDFDSYYSSAPDNHLPPTWVELLLEVDAKSYPKFAKAILAKEDGIDGWSMGCDVEKTVCSHCHNEAFSPDDYCDHVKNKGAEFDFYSSDGTKISRKSYEDCYGIKFFEISGVFDPADETATTRDMIHELQKEAKVADVKGLPPNPNNWERCPKCQHPLDPAEDSAYCENCGANIEKESSTKTAEHPGPQADALTAPKDTDTLREERICPQCGSDADDVKCEVCGYEFEPEGLDNPDLQRHQELDLPNLIDQSGGEVTLDQDGNPVGGPDTATGESLGEQPGSFLQTRKPTFTGKVISDMRWEPKANSRVAGRINTVERPIKPESPEPATDEPKETVISDQTKPVTAAFRTAQDLIERAKRNPGENMSDQKKVAADPADESGKAKKQVDVTGVGGVDEASAEEASKADAQVDVQGTGGTGVEDVSPDKKEDLPEAGEDDAGFNKDKTTEDSGSTSTFPKGKGDLDAGSPHDTTAFPRGGAKKGTEPSDPSGKADERVDLEDSDFTDRSGQGVADQWTGTEGNGVTRQADPVTRDTINADPPPRGSKTFSKRLITALKIADNEIALGLLEEDKKYDRLQELEDKDEVSLVERLDTLSGVKQAGLKRQASTRQGGVGRLPSFRRVAKEEPEAPKPDALVQDSALFRR